MPPTHEVFNQAPALSGYDVADDPAMLDALRREGASWATGAVQELGRQANENPPTLRTHDRFGNRVDEVEFHPAWHELMTVAVRHGLHAAPWYRGHAGGRGRGGRDLGDGSRRTARLDPPARGGRGPGRGVRRAAARRPAARRHHW